MNQPTPTRSLIRHIASEFVLARMESIARFFPVWPAVLPSRSDPTLRPLAIGIDQDLVAKAVVPPDGTWEEMIGEVRRAIRYLTQSNSYRRALGAAGAFRHNADAHPVEPVLEAHAAYALSQLPGYTKPKSPGAAAPDSHEVITVKISALKVSLPLSPDQLAPVGETVKVVDLQLDLGDGKPFVTQFSGKNYRRAIRQIEELRAAGSEVVILLQGRLVAGQKIEGAGLSVQMRTPKTA
jgi:hypothetical protein